MGNSVTLLVQSRPPVDPVPDLWSCWFRLTEGGRSDAEWTGAPLTYTDAEEAAATAPPAAPPLVPEGGQQPPTCPASPQNLPAAEVTPASTVVTLLPPFKRKSITF